MTVGFSLETIEARRNGRNIFQMMKEKHCPPRILYPVKLCFRSEEEIKTSSDEGKLREFVTSSPTLRKWLRKFSKQKGNK